MVDSKTASAVIAIASRSVSEDLSYSWDCRVVEYHFPVVFTSIFTLVEIYLITTLNDVVKHYFNRIATFNRSKNYLTRFHITSRFKLDNVVVAVFFIVQVVSIFATEYRLFNTSGSELNHLSVAEEEEVHVFALNICTSSGERSTHSRSFLSSIDYGLELSTNSLHQFCILETFSNVVNLHSRNQVSVVNRSCHQSTLCISEECQALRSVANFYIIKCTNHTAVNIVGCSRFEFKWSAEATIENVVVVVEWRYVELDIITLFHECECTISRKGLLSKVRRNHFIVVDIEHEEAKSA